MKSLAHHSNEEAHKTNIEFQANIIFPGLPCRFLTCFALFMAVIHQQTWRAK